MKTENEFSEYFAEACQLSSADKLSKNYWSDLTSHLSFYFSNEDRWTMTHKAALMLKSGVENKSQDEAWKDVLRNFNENNYWGFQPVDRKPKVGQTEDQKIFWKLFKYVWALIQSMIVLKFAVTFFGVNAANNPDQISVAWVWIIFGLLVASLAFFVYRNRHDKG